MDRFLYGECRDSAEELIFTPFVTVPLQTIACWPGDIGLVVVVVVVQQLAIPLFAYGWRPLQ